MDQCDVDKQSSYLMCQRHLCVCACMYTLLPMLALLRAGASLTPSPVTATTHPALRQPSTMRSFWVGEVRAKTISWYPVRISSTLSSLISCKNKITRMTHSCKCAVHVLLLHFCKFCVSAYSIPKRISYTCMSY